MESKKYKFEWYQTETEIIISISKRGVSSTECKAVFDDTTNKLEILYLDETLFSANLYQSIKQIKINCSSSRVEVRLEKLTNERWIDIYAKTEKNFDSVVSQQSVWDRIAKEVEKEEESDPNSVDKLFQKIYRDADDDVKKAMMKSFSESCGTVLSTNWNEIKNKKTEIKPPDSMEFKKFET